MGQGQSSTSGTAQEETPAKSDYYDLLGVERTASEDELKKAYRRKALELHPDRNYGNVENATRLFAEIQSAYEVLSDPQERAWYDSHRDVLLRGDQPSGADGSEFSYNIRMTTTDEVLKLMLKFNGRIEYGDAPSGFYGGLQDFFKQLAKEEDIACQWEDVDFMEYPEFGLKDDDYDDVVRPFYAAWTGFATKKSYSWKDEYRLSEAPDRRIRRLMEKENKKAREEAIQEYNNAVRSLIAFVRKRDPRVKNNQKSEAERQKALREAAAAQAAKSRAARQAKLQELDQAVIPEWAKSRTVDEHEGGFSSESEEEEHEYDCIVCDKTFKSEAQFHAHEKSKKHVKLLKQLQKEMRAEGRELDLEQQPIEHSNDDDESMQKQDLLEEDNTITQEKGNTTAQNLGIDEQNAQDETARPAAKMDPAPAVDSVDVSAGSDDDYAPRATVEDRLAGGDADLSTRLRVATLEGTPATSDTDASGTPKLGKAKQKRAKRAAAQAVTMDTKASAKSKCAECLAEFASRNALFDHIKDEGHAAVKTQMRSGAAKGGKGKKR